MEIEVLYKVTIPEDLVNFLYEEAELNGHCYDDAGKIRAIRRLLIDMGVDGAIPHDRLLEVDIQIAE